MKITIFLILVTLLHFIFFFGFLVAQDHNLIFSLNRSSLIHSIAFIFSFSLSLIVLDAGFKNYGNT